MDQVKIFLKVFIVKSIILGIGASSENNFRTNSLKSRKEIAAGWIGGAAMDGDQTVL